MRASELKVGQDFKFDGQRKFRSITEIKEITTSDRALPEHIGKLLVFFDDDSQLLFSKNDGINIESTVSNHLKKEPNRYDFEQYCNHHYAQSMDYEIALKNFIYLTIGNQDLQRTITLKRLKTVIRTKQFGWLLRKYDPSRFTAEYEASRIK